MKCRPYAVSPEMQHAFPFYVILRRFECSNAYLAYARGAQWEVVPADGCIRFQVPGSDFSPRPIKPPMLPGSVPWYQLFGKDSTQTCSIGWPPQVIA